jgi:hypothetical protein
MRKTLKDHFAELSVRKIEAIELEQRAAGLNVTNLCGLDYRLRKLQGAAGQVPRCYASVLGNCKGGISREHYISENILEQLTNIECEEMPWLRAKAGKISPKDAVVGNCLCEYHNGFLSPLDSLAGKAFENLVELAKPDAPDLFIWGPSLARWLLKILIGIVAAKHAVIKGEKVDLSETPVEWIEILFGKRDFPEGYGLYMTPTIGAKINIAKRLRMETLLLDGKMRGVRVEIAGVEFLLNMAEPAKAFNPDHPSFANILYRPRGMNVDKRQNRIRIFWT